MIDPARDESTLVHLQLPDVPAERSEELAEEAAVLLGVAIAVETLLPIGTIELPEAAAKDLRISFSAWLQPGAVPDAEALARWSDARGLAPWTLRRVASIDWTAAWRDQHVRRRPGRRIVLLPPWDDAPLGRGELGVVLEPGMAFGLGDHPSTALCVQALESAPPTGQRVFDVGCGSGILGLAALALGAAEATMVDIDPDAVRAARANAERNGVSARVRVLEGGPEAVGERFDLVVVNVFDALLVPILATVAERVRPGGRLIAGGVRDVMKTKVRGRLEELGFQLDDARHAAGWAALDAIAAPGEITG